MDKIRLTAIYTALLCICVAAAEATTVTTLDAPATTTTNRHYVSNRAPLAPSPLIKLPIRAIEPRGWIRKQLDLQAMGFHGHLHHISRFLEVEGNAWLDPKHGKHGWEEVPYWLKGFQACALVLRDERMMAETHKWIEAALASLQEDGWFGPEANRTRIKGAPDLWPNMVMLFCLQDHYDFTGDKRVIALMRRHFQHLGTIADDQFLPGYWDRMRGGDLLFSVYWLYNRTGEPWLLRLAHTVHRNTARWDEGIINWHNVNIAQAFGEPATYWMQSGNTADLAAADRNWQHVRELYGQVPGGMFGADENARPGCVDPRQAVETCGMVEEMLSDETLLTITGHTGWADRCEDVAFNALPAALTADMKALRYLTAPNMPLSDRHNKSPGLQNGGPMLHMNPHGHRCCQHNWGHGWPYYAQHLWFATPDNGLAVALYGASQVEATVADGVHVMVEETTHYPFDDMIQLRVEADRDVRFPLYLRVPGWCEAPTLTINEDDIALPGELKGYLRIDRIWKPGDQLALTLPMAVRLRTWEQNADSVSVDRGPLTYSLQIGESYVREGGNDEWPAWEIHPTTPWNYGLVLDPDTPTSSFEVVKKPWQRNNMPFTHAGTPIALKARGKRIPQWVLDQRGLVMPLQPSPVLSDEPIEDIMLIPMGAARLRICSFPVIGESERAHTWQAPPEPNFTARASHCFGGDMTEAVADGTLPRRSNDNSVPRHTWWPHKGSAEWLEAHFAKPRTVSKVGVYWFDDTGNGFCRVPASWRLFYREGEAWKLAKTSGAYATAPDTLNTVTIRPVQTTGLRMEVQLQKSFSAGVLEWTVE